MAARTAAWLPYGLPRVTRVADGSSRVRLVASNPSGSLLCVVTSERVEVWSFVNDAMCLGSAPLAASASTRRGATARRSDVVVGLVWENDVSVIVADEVCLTFFALTATERAQIDVPCPTWYEGHRPQSVGAVAAAGGGQSAVGSATSYIASLFGGGVPSEDGDGGPLSRGGPASASGSARGNETRERAIHLDAAQAMRVAALAQQRVKVRAVKIVRMRPEWGAVSCFAALPPDLEGDSSAGGAKADRHGSLFIGTDSGRVLIAAWSGKLLAWFDAPRVPQSTRADACEGDEAQEETGEEERAGAAVRDLAVDAIARYAAIVTAEGNAFCWKMTEKRTAASAEDEHVSADVDAFSPLRPYLLHGNGASAALCVRFGGSVPRRIAAVGCSDGVVVLYYVADDAVAENVRSVPLALASVGAAASVTGCVTALRWTNDGILLAVGYARSGVSVWSESGRRVMSTISDETATNAAALEGGNSTAELEFVVRGTSALAWDALGYQLICAPHAASRDARVGSALVAFTFVRTVQQPAPCAALLGRASLLVLRGLAHSPTTLSWQRFAPPPRYVVPNAPLRLAATALSTSAASAPPVPVHRMAVAGQHGVALFSSVSNRWRLFGDERQERALRCSALAWWESTVIVAATRSARPARGVVQPGSIAATERAWSHALVAFPHWHLDRSSVMCCVQLPVLRGMPLANQAPVLMTVNRASIIVAMADSRILHFRVQTSDLSTFTPRGCPRMSITLVGEHAMKAKVATRSLGSSQWRRTRRAYTLRALVPLCGGESSSGSCAVLDSSGCLTYVRTGSTRNQVASAQVQVLSGVRACIPMRVPDRSSSEAGPQDPSGSQSDLVVFWLLLDNWRVRVWIPHTVDASATDGATALSEARGFIAPEDPIIKFAPSDCAALVGTYSAMMLVQAAIDPSRSGTSAQHGNAAVPLRWIHLETKVQPTLHGVLLALLLQRRADATSAASSFVRAAQRSAWPQVRRSVELLLHAAIEADKREQRPASPADSILAAACVVATALPFPLYAEAIARCGRTIDSSRWRSLFNDECAGRVDALFQQSISTGSLTVATTLLPIFVSLSPASIEKEGGPRSLPSWFGDFVALLRAVLGRGAACLRPDRLARGGGSEGGAWLQVRARLRLVRSYVRPLPHTCVFFFPLILACSRHAAVCAAR